jgi:2-keto-3-deoxy-L-rhamnonate aldolase RhmA
LDLEVIGKAERQRGKDTVISQHRRERIQSVKQAMVGGELLVRTNPVWPGIREEIDFCIDAGADLIMVPMVRLRIDVREYCHLVRGRVPVCPLIETRAALNDLDAILATPGVTEIHFGLNDLHLDLGLQFLFEVIAQGHLERAAEICQRRGMRFGIGGIATLSGGAVPGEYVLGEYVRLGSSAVILSRAFHQRAADLADLQAKIDLPSELAKLQLAMRRLNDRNRAEVERDRLRFQEAVRNVVSPRAQAA